MCSAIMNHIRTYTYKHNVLWGRDVYWWGGVYFFKGPLGAFIGRFTVCTKINESTDELSGNSKEHSVTVENLVLIVGDVHVSSPALDAQFIVFAKPTEDTKIRQVIYRSYNAVGD